MIFNKRLYYLVYFVSVFASVRGELRLGCSDDEQLCKYDGLNFDLSDVDMTKVPRYFLSSPLVNCLNLKNNRLWNLDEQAFDQLPNLYYLNLGDNCLPFDDGFSYNLIAVETLVLDDAFNPGSKCPPWRYQDYGSQPLDIFSKLSNLKKLYLRNNNLLGFVWHDTVPNITHLYLDDNKIHVANLSSSVPPTLTHLSLATNGIRKFDNSLLLQQLEELTLDYNHIEVLCSNPNCRQRLWEFEETPGSFWFSNSNVDPPSYMDLTGATKLKKLSLAWNNLKEIDAEAFGDLHSLEYLDLSGNTMSNFSTEVFNDLSNLDTLLLASNELTSIPNLTELKNLKTLVLNRNEIESIDSAGLSNLPQLEILSLADNEITSVESTSFYALTSLLKLDLSGNMLTTLPENWISPENILQGLYLDRNLFTGIENMSLGNVTKIDYLDIAGNLFDLLLVKSLSCLPESTVINIKQWDECNRQKS